MLWPNPPPLLGVAREFSGDVTPTPAIPVNASACKHLAHCPNVPSRFEYRCVNEQFSGRALQVDRSRLPCQGLCALRLLARARSRAIW